MYVQRNQLGSSILFQFDKWIEPFIYKCLPYSTMECDCQKFEPISGQIHDPSNNLADSSAYGYVHNEDNKNSGPG